MSFKLYDGLMIETDDIFGFAHKAYMRAQQVLKKLGAGVVAQQVIEIIDAPESDSEKYSRPLIFSATDRYREQNDKLNRNSALHDSLRFTMCFYHLEGTRYLGYVYAGEQDYLDSILEMDEVRDYHYQNQTDPPDDVPEDEWDERKEAWDRALDEEGSMSSWMMIQLPFADTMLTHFGIFGSTEENKKTWERIAQRQQSAKNRLRACASRAVMSNVLHKQQDSNKNLKDNSDPDIAMCLYFQRMDALNAVLRDNSTDWFLDLGTLPEPFVPEDMKETVEELDPSKRVVLDDEKVEALATKVFEHIQWKDTITQW